MEENMVIAPNEEIGVEELEENPRPPSSREGDRPQAVEGVNAGGGRSNPLFQPQGL